MLAALTDRSKVSSKHPQWVVYKYSSCGSNPLLALESTSTNRHTHLSEKGRLFLRTHIPAVVCTLPWDTVCRLTNWTLIYFQKQFYESHTLRVQSNLQQCRETSHVIDILGGVLSQGLSMALDCVKHIPRAGFCPPANLHIKPVSRPLRSIKQLSEVISGKGLVQKRDHWGVQTR